MQTAFNNVQVFIDEVPAGSFGQQIRVRHSEIGELENNFHFMKWLSVDSKGGFFLNPEYFDELKKYWEEGHAHSNQMKDIVWCLLNSSAMTKSTDDSGFWLTSYSANPILLASQWCVSFTLLGCGASDSEFLYRAKEHLKYPVLKADDKFQPDISRAKFTNTENITIHYVLQEKASMTKLSSVYLEALQWVKRNYRENFLYTTNNDKSTSALNIDFTSLADSEFSELGQRVSMASYGLNYYAGHSVNRLTREQLAGIVSNVDAAYQGYAKCAYLASVNMDPFSLIRLKEYCEVMDWDFQTLYDKWSVQQNTERCLQVISRTVIRNRANKEKVSFLVPDKSTAEYLKNKYFYNCTLTHTGIKTPVKENKGNIQYQKVQELRLQGKRIKEISQTLGLSLPQVKRYSAKCSKEAA
ncbi:hypothetical protein BG55_20450 [Erwinia mallotivora]|uniref:Uncharacterized protein n=2 Tax=Erwinia mallotivora TaxID=69222 RepID=A0A014N3A1_9GAMM|nr:hypothetical protein BG55_20450 [Erwinia mallotivora]